MYRRWDRTAFVSRSPTSTEPARSSWAMCPRSLMDTIVPSAGSTLPPSPVGLETVSRRVDWLAIFTSLRTVQPKLLRVLGCSSYIGGFLSRLADGHIFGCVCTLDVIMYVSHSVFSD